MKKPPQLSHGRGFCGGKARPVYKHPAEETGRLDFQAPSLLLTNRNFEFPAFTLG